MGEVVSPADEVFRAGRVGYGEFPGGPHARQLLHVRKDDFFAAAGGDRGDRRQARSKREAWILWCVRVALLPAKSYTWR
jgi:hypothetical protein